MSEVRNFALIEQLTLPHIEEAVDKYYEYMHALFSQNRFREFLAIHDRFSSMTRPDWFLSPVGNRVPELELMYLESQLRESLKDTEHSQTYLESVLSKNFIDAIETHSGGNVILDGALSASARTALSRIAFLVSGNMGSDVKSQLRFLLVAIHIDHSNIEAWETVLQGWLLSSDEKQRLFKSIAWSHDQQAVAALLEPYLNRASENSDQLSTDRFRLARTFRRAFLSGNAASVSSLMNKVKKDELALLNVAELASVALYQQGDSATLFALASRMLKHEPVCPDAFFVGGMYYLSIKRFDVARKFFSKAKGSVHGWIGYGLAFSFSDESGHAISAFRSATVMFPKCVFPWLYAGIESIRTNELKLAQSFLISALALCDGDNTGTESRLRGLVLNEIGMICLKAEQFDIAAENMRLCCQLSEEIPNPFVSVMFSNLGHAMLKIRDMDGAVKAFEMAISHNRLNGNALAGLGYCHHCRGNLSRAIDLYSSSLYQLSGNRKAENLVNNLIQLAVNEYSFSVKQSTVVPPQDEEALVLNAF